MRAGVQKDKTIGSHWLHLPREMQNICQVSAGRNVIMAIDDKGDISKYFQKFLIFFDSMNTSDDYFRFFILSFGSYRDPNLHRFFLYSFNGIQAWIFNICLLYTSPSPRDQRGSRMPSSA